MSSITARALRAPLWAHACALFVVVLALLPLARIDTVFFADEGSGLAQAQQLADGDGWTRPLSFPEADPENQTFPLFNGDRRGDRLAPLGHHAAYAVAVVPWYAVAGTAGAVTLSLIAVAAAAYLAGLITRRLRPGLEVPALWAVGVGSPLFFDGYLVVAHTLTAALTAGASLALLRVIAGERRSVMIAVAAVCVSAAGLLRNEAILFGVALGVVAIAFAVRSRDRALASFGVAVGLAAVVARVAESMLRARVVSGNGSTTFSVEAEGGSRIAQQLKGAFITLFLPSYGEFDAGDIVLVFGVTCAIVAAVIARRRPDDRSGLMLFGGLAAGLLLVRLVLEAGPVPGIVWACPLLAIGVALADRRMVRNRRVQVLLAVLALFGAAVLATQYGSGGGREWGWRYFSLALPVCVPLALVAIVDGAARISRSDRRVAGWLLVAVCVAVSALAFLASRAIRDENRQIADGIRATYLATPAADGGKPVVLTTQWGTVDRFNWDHVDDTRWLVIAPTERAQVAVYLDRIERLGVGQLTFVTSNLDEDRPFVLAHGDIVSDRELPADHRALTVRLHR